MIESFKLLTKSLVKNGILVLILSLPQFKLLFKDVRNLSKFVKVNSNLLLKAEIQFCLSLEAQKHKKLLRFYKKSKDLLVSWLKNLKQVKKRKFLMSKHQTGMMSTMLLNLESSNWMLCIKTLLILLLNKLQQYNKVFICCKPLIIWLKETVSELV